MRIISCLKGHTMSYVTYSELALINPAYRNGCWCDICHERININVIFTRNRVYHCGLCNYDVCQNCVGDTDTITQIHPIRSYLSVPNFPSYIDERFTL